MNIFCLNIILNNNSTFDYDEYGLRDIIFRNKDINYLKELIQKEIKYFESLNDLLNKNNIKDKYNSYLKQIEDEIY